MKSHTIVEVLIDMGHNVYMKNDSSRLILTMTRVRTPLGGMLAAGTDNGIYLLEFVDLETPEKQLETLKRVFRAGFITGTNEHLEALRLQLGEYFTCGRREFSLTLQMKGTPFQHEVWEALSAIPYGETRSYSDQARMVNRPRAVRAVARANASNHISIIIPCHRIIGKDGSLVGYGGGLWRKRYLLELESGHSGIGMN